MKHQQETESINDSLKCKDCGAVLHFSPGTNNLKCDYCGVSNEIATTSANSTIESFDYDEFITRSSSMKNPELQVANCKGCGSETTFEENVTAVKCAFCASPLVLEINKNYVRPHYVLPFVVDQSAAIQHFQTWLKKLSFAPNDLAQNNNPTTLRGMYLPHWMYDCDTTTDYTGKRGEYYYTTETYTENVNGKNQTKTREVQHTRWTRVSGVVDCSFLDLVVSATKSLPTETLRELEPWNLNELVEFDERYLSGFSSETFQLSPQEGLKTAKTLMVPEIESAIIDDIGGDDQEIGHTKSDYQNLAIKYAMLPVWVSSYNYKNKLYQFTINACTGEVTGKRPYSIIKIILTIVFVLAIIAMLAFYFL